MTEVSLPGSASRHARPPGLSAGIAATVGALVALGLAAPVSAARAPIVVQGAAECGSLSAAYIALVSADGDALLLSGEPFPGGRRHSRAADGRLGGLDGWPGLQVAPTATGDVWAWSMPRLASAPAGCLAFDKDRFTWESDLYSYVRYLSDLLVEARSLGSVASVLRVADRSVALEVARPGRDRARLSGPEGAMLGYGRLDDPVRFFFVPVLLGPAAEELMVRVLRTEGSAFGDRTTAHLVSVLVPPGDVVVSASDPVFRIEWLEP